MMSGSRVQLRVCEVDLVLRAVYRGTEIERLTSKEALLLGYLAERPNQTVSREELLTNVWGYHYSVITRAVDSTMSRLRKKVERDPHDPDHLMASYGAGFVFVPLPADVEPEPVRPSPPSRDGNLPPRFTSFVGRQAELRAMDSALSSGACLVTLIGTAGVGKTRLAMEYAATRWSGPVWFVDAAEAHTGSQLAARMAAVLGLEASPGSLAEGIRSQAGALFVIDNLEQVWHDAGELLTQILGETPEARFVCTSRRALDVGAETRIEVAPLDSIDARDLFLDRARAVRADFAATEDEINRVTRRLDGLPFALELAAARVRVLSARQLSSKSMDSASLLPKGGRRGETLADTIAWSWNLLGAREHRVLTQLSVFGASFDAAAAKAVLDLPQAADVLDVLQELVEHHLVRVHFAEDAPDEVRFGLFQSVRDFARARLLEEPSLAKATLSRMALHYARLHELVTLDAVDRRGLHPVRETLLPEASNLYAVVELKAEPIEARVQCGLALLSALAYTGPNHAVKELGDRLLEIDSGEVSRTPLAQDLAARPSRPPTAAWDDQRGRSSLADLRAEIEWRAIESRGRDGAIVEAARAGDDLLPRIAPGRLALHTRLELGWMHRRTGAFDRAFELGSEAIRLADELGMLGPAALARAFVGSLLVERGRDDEGERLLEEAEQVARRQGGLRTRAIVLADLAALDLGRGDYASAVARYEEAADRMQALGLELGMAVFLTNLALSLLHVGEKERARERIEHAKRILTRYGSVAVGQAHVVEARCHIAFGEFELADALSRKLEDAFRARGAVRGLVSALAVRAEALRCMGDERRARLIYREARGLARDLRITDRSAVGFTLRHLGQLFDDEPAP